MSFFNDFSEARRCTRSRPSFHPLAIERAAETIGIEETFPLVLDIACGMGQSSTALSSIAERVIGFDISWSMLANAEPNEQVGYVLAQAEDQLLVIHLQLGKLLHVLVGYSP